MPRLTIIRDDNAVYVDGRALTVDCSALASDIRAVQWNGTAGHIEYDEELARAPDPITSIDAYLSLLTAWETARAAADHVPTWAELTTEQKRDRVNAERDRRMQTFTFGGVVYDFDQLSRARIDKAKTNAMAAIELGLQPGDYRWADPDTDFGWITKANSFTLMDAQTALAFGLAAAAWEGKLIVAARNLKDQNPIPQDYADDSHWPSS